MDGSICAGIIFIIVGILNMMGNTKIIHSYHRKRVSEENLKPFGKTIGIGTITIGVGFIAFGIFTLLEDLLEIDALDYLGIASLVVLAIAGLGIIVYAMKKYNGGIF